jgi:hypothetical protein
MTYSFSQPQTNLCKRSFRIRLAAIAKRGSAPVFMLRCITISGEIAFKFSSIAGTYLTKNLVTTKPLKAHVSVTREVLLLKVSIGEARRDRLPAAVVVRPTRTRIHGIGEAALATRDGCVSRVGPMRQQVRSPQISPSCIAAPGRLRLANVPFDRASL